MKNAGIFGTVAGDVFQSIDTAAGTLQNVIEFPPEGAFIVDSSIAVDAVSGGRRTDFKFTSATLKKASGDVVLPPFGQGWFESVFVNDKYRLTRDVRGDYLVVVKDGGPRRFG